MIDENDVIESQDSTNDTQEETLNTTLKQAFDRARDEQGKFAKKEEAPIVETAVDKAPEPTQVNPAAPIADAPKPIKAPDSWTPAAKAKFAELPEDIRAEVMRREEEVHKGFTRFDEERVLGKQIKDVMAPYLPMIKAEGGNMTEAVGNLLQTAYTLRTANPEQKRTLLLGLAQQFGVDLGVQVPQQGYGVDPTIAQLQQQVMQLQQERQSQQYYAEQQENAHVNSTIDSFASDPSNIYFSNVRNDMAALLQNGSAKDLQEAYDMACWARPDIRPLMLQSQQKQGVDQSREKASKARMVGGSVAGSPVGSGGKSTVNPNATLREQIAASLGDARTGRV